MARTRDKTPPNDVLAFQLRVNRLVPYEREYRLFAEHVGSGPGVMKRLADAGMKNFRFDFAFTDVQIAVEINGGIWLAKSGHNTGGGILRDMRKTRDAGLLGWRVLSFTPAEVRKGVAVLQIKQAVTEARAAK